VSSIRQCYVCALPVPSDDIAGWEATKVDYVVPNFAGQQVEGAVIQYRCPKHRVGAPKQFATLGDLLTVKAKFNALYGKFGK
jgi:hypothetical protein